MQVVAEDEPDLAHLALGLGECHRAEALDLALSGPRLLRVLQRYGFIAGPRAGLHLGG